MAFAQTLQLDPTGRRRPVLITTALAAVMTLLAALVVTQPAFAAGTIGATFTSAGDWGTGHEVQRHGHQRHRRHRQRVDGSSSTCRPAPRSAASGTPTSPAPATTTWRRTRLGRPLAPGRLVHAGATIGTGAVQDPDQLHDQRRGLYAAAPPPAPPTTHRRRPRRPPTTTPTPTPTPTTTTPPPPGRQEGRRLLRRVGRLRPQLPRQEHRDQRLGGEADPHQLRVRQRHRRPVRDRRHLRRLRQGLHRRPRASTASPTPGTSRCAATSTSCASSRRMYPDLKVLWSFGGWTWSGGFAPGRGEPDRLRRTPATTWSRTRAGRTSSTASTSTGSTRTPAA